MKKDSKVNKPILIISIIAGVAAVIYIAVALFFSGHYFPGTIIGDAECGAMSPEQLKSELSQRAKEHALHIIGRNDIEEDLDPEAIDLEFKFGTGLEDICSKQNGFTWIMHLDDEHIYPMPVEVSFDEAKLKEAVKQLTIFKKENCIEPENAEIGDYDSELGKYPIIEGDKGSVPDEAKTVSAIMNALKELKNDINLDEEDCYKHAQIESDNKELRNFAGKLNRYVSAKVNYDWHGFDEEIGGDQISTWLVIDKDAKTVAIDPELVRGYIDVLCKRNDTFGKERTFKTTEGKEIKITEGSYGWRTNRADETSELIKIIRRGSVVNREPLYITQAQGKGEQDWGDSYVEVNLTKQHLYVYSEGKMVVESDFVSGNTSKGNGTHTGIFGLTYKTLDAVLRGPGYASPVKYWMPFNGNEGMHDASWRSTFGGEIYKTNGSHGCVNLPRKKAGEIYEYVHKDFPVIVFYEPKEEKVDKEEKAEEIKENKEENKEEKKPENKTENVKPQPEEEIIVPADPALLQQQLIEQMLQEKQDDGYGGESTVNQDDEAMKELLERQAASAAAFLAAQEAANQAAQQAAQGENQ